MEKIFLLFGSSGNLGSESVKYFLNQEYDSYYFFTRKPFEINSTKNHNVILVDDLTVEKNVHDAFSHIYVTPNSILYLFSTIGTYWGGKTISETPYNEWLRLQNINLNSSFLIAKYFVQKVEKAVGGSICFTSAFSSLKISEGIAAYGVSKNALNYLVKSLSEEGKTRNFSANAVAPYIIDNDENGKWAKDVSTLIKSEHICKVVQNIFDNQKVISGNIFELPKTIIND